MSSLLPADELRSTLDRAFKRAWEKKIDRQWKELEDRFRKLSDRENVYTEEELDEC